jgi:hypothetical protein
MSGKQIRKRQGSLKSAGCGWSLGRGRRRPPILELQLYQSINWGLQKAEAMIIACVGSTHCWANFNYTSEGALLYEEFSIASHPVTIDGSCMTSPENKASRSAFAAAASRGHFRHLLGRPLAIPDSLQGHSGVFQPQHGPAHLA